METIVHMHLGVHASARPWSLEFKSFNETLGFFFLLLLRQLNEHVVCWANLFVQPQIIDKTFVLIDHIYFSVVIAYGLLLETLQEFVIGCLSFVWSPFAVESLLGDLRHDCIFWNFFSSFMLASLNLTSVFCQTIRNVMCIYFFSAMETERRYSSAVTNHLN